MIGGLAVCGLRFVVLLRGCWGSTLAVSLNELVQLFKVVYDNFKAADVDLHDDLHW